GASEVRRADLLSGRRHGPVPSARMGREARRPVEHRRWPMSPRYPPRASPLPARIAAIGLAALMSGISLASMFYGALTVPYYAAALSGLALCVPFVLQRMTDRLPAIIVIGSLPVVLTALQYWFLDIYAFIPP